jgi:hypothetical protein
MVSEKEAVNNVAQMGGSPHGDYSNGKHEEKRKIEGFDSSA